MSLITGVLEIISCPDPENWSIAIRPPNIVTDPLIMHKALLSVKREKLFKYWIT